MRPRDLNRFLEDMGWPTSPVIQPGAFQAPAAKSAVADQGTSSEDPLAALALSAADCQLCRLSEKRQKVVFGEGDPHTVVMFIGEGPGAEEDRTGRPFVGQAGQLLERMLFAIGLRRDQVYITNIVKCRPPGNRDPKDDEVAACSPYLDQQIELIAPRVLVALGKPASHRLLGTSKPIGALRGRWASYKGIPLMPLFHPAYMLRTPSAKREAWADLKMIRQRLESTDSG
ncbi:MAG: uracil-DNA glycosylase [Acidobacteriota bacterium]|nr:uracil-DNA glycosylase [Acidobacteriota bacterium]